MTMKTTWTLAVSAVTALSAGTAVAASAAEAAPPPPAEHSRQSDTPLVRLAEVPPPPVVGDTVPASAVDATRDAGLSVFVSPSGDGSGLVIDPYAPLPTVIAAELDAVNEPMTDLEDAAQQLVRRSAMRAALDAADTSVLVVYATPTFDADGTVTGVQYGVSGNQEAPLEFATSHQLRLSPSHDLAVATWQPFLAKNPQFTLVDTTLE